MIDRIRGWLHDWRHRRWLRGAIEKKFGRMPEIGDVVCDCRFQHLPIARIDDNDTVTLVDSNNKEFTCSLLHCCDPVPHPEAHP